MPMIAAQELARQASLIYYRTGMTPVQMEEALRLCKNEILELKVAISNLKN